MINCYDMLKYEFNNKQDFKNFILNQTNPNINRRVFWIKNFTEFYKELQTWTFPDNFKFTQKIYHYINGDPELKLGICPECGKRCKFNSIKKGYYLCNDKNCCFKVKYINNKIQETCIERYGCCATFQYVTFKEKSKQTKLEKYCDENYNNREKAKSSCLEKYNCDNPAQIEEVKEKTQQTCLKRYGVKVPAQSKEVQDKMKQTCLERYNDKNYNNREKAEQTCLERYNENNFTKTDKYKELYNNCEWVNTKNKKCFLTKKKNNSFNTSKIESQIEQYLISNNIIYEHLFTSEKYPFSCDFYFPEKDLYVEIQGSWTHGPHPFTGSEEDLELLEKWMVKNTKYYNNAIKTWTKRDVRKRETAKQNNLNYLEIFSCDFEFCINEILKNI